MRVSGDAVRATDARAAARASFRDALARARGPGDARPAGSPAPVPALARPALRGPARRTPPDPAPASLAPAPWAARLPQPEPAPGAALRAALRALPAAIDAARLRAGGPLELSLGGALAVELRPSDAGVAIVLRPAPSLARIAAAELPGLVRALRARGVAVARAEVRPRGAPGGDRPAGAR